MREGRDFRSTEELAARLGPQPRRRWVRASAAEALARCVVREMWWLEHGGGLPGDVSWDLQPAWRVELWEHYLVERELGTAAARSIGEL